MLALGDTVLLPKPGQEKSHLWVLVTAADPQTGDVIIANFTTLRPHSDTTVIIQPGEHRFVDRPTVVFYSDARVAKLTLLENAIHQGVASQHDPVSQSLLQRVQAGPLVSPLTPTMGQIDETASDPRARHIHRKNLVAETDEEETE